MASPARDIVPILEAAEIGTFGAIAGWGIFVGQMPDSPHKVVVLYDAPGQSPNPKFALDFPAIQVSVRASPDSYEEGWDKALAVKNLLLGMDSQTISGKRWTSVTMLGDINALGQDEKRRPLFSLNFALILEPPATDNRESL